MLNVTTERFSAGLVPQLGGGTAALWNNLRVETFNL